MFLFLVMDMEPEESAAVKDFRCSGGNSVRRESQTREGDYIDRRKRWK